MARPPRIEFPGAFYHVIVRGNQKQPIFLDDQDRVEYLRRVSHYKEKCGFVLYSYILMSNHVHLLVETVKDPLSKIMQLISFTYARYFNKKYDKVGHLFQGRYKAILCDRDEYLLGLVRYIHLNPVRAKIVTMPEEFQWSSHSEYIGKRKGLIDTDSVLQLFSDNVSQARRLYRKFVQEALGTEQDETFYKTLDQQILGDEKFLKKVQKRVDDTDRPIRKPSLQAILKAIEEVTGVHHDEMFSRRRTGDAVFARGLLVSVWREVGYKMVSLKPVMKRDVSMLSRLSNVAYSDKGRKAIKTVLKILDA